MAVVTRVRISEPTLFLKLCKNCDNSQEHVINNYGKIEKLRIKLTKELNDLDNTKKIKHFWTPFSTGIIVKILMLKRGIIKIKDFQAI